MVFRLNLIRTHVVLYKVGTVFWSRCYQGRDEVASYEIPLPWTKTLATLISTTSHLIVLKKVLPDILGC